MFCKTCGNEIKEGTKFCAKCGNEVQKKPAVALVAQIPKKTRKFFTKKNLIIFGSIAIGAIIVISAIAYYQKNHESVADTDRKNLEIASSVVNIYCENDTEEASGGSGTIVTEDGIVLTNAHIIPANADSDNLQKCVVILPDPTTGAPKEMYYAYPVVIPEISEKYDLAFVQIDDVFIDDEGTVWGDYPKKFPAYDSSKYCTDENVKLGEPIRIYGYPSLSGGRALTVTEGVVSSLLIDEGLIVTSAKISSGNSGGLAVDQYGCSIGVPSMVSVDESESLGVIISTNLIAEFMEEALLMEGYNNQ